MDPISFIIGLAAGVIGDRFIPGLSKKVGARLSSWFKKTAEENEKPETKKAPSKKTRKKAAAGAAA